MEISSSIAGSGSRILGKPKTDSNILYIDLAFSMTPGDGETEIDLVFINGWIQLSRRALFQKGEYVRTHPNLYRHFTSSWRSFLCNIY